MFWALIAILTALQRPLAVMLLSKLAFETDETFSAECDITVWMCVIYACLHLFRKHSFYSMIQNYLVLQVYQCSDLAVADDCKCNELIDNMIKKALLKVRYFLQTVYTN